MNHKRFSQEQLVGAVASSTSFRQVLSKLSIKAAGGNYATLKKAIVRYNLDISHFTGQAWNKGKVYQKRLLQQYLDNSQAIQSNKLRKRLLKDGIFSSVCNSCKLSFWLEKPIPLELDHIDGNHLNNNLSNLRLLCPNCHAQTPTYRGKNIPKLRSALPSVKKGSPNLTPST